MIEQLEKTARRFAEVAPWVALVFAWAITKIALYLW